MRSPPASNANADVAEAGSISGAWFTGVGLGSGKGQPLPHPLSSGLACAKQTPDIPITTTRVATTFLAGTFLSVTNAPSIWSTHSFRRIGRVSAGGGLSAGVAGTDRPGVTEQGISQFSGTGW